MKKTKTEKDSIFWKLILEATTRFNNRILPSTPLRRSYEVKGTPIY